MPMHEDAYDEGLQAGHAAGLKVCIANIKHRLKALRRKMRSEARYYGKASEVHYDFSSRVSQQGRSLGLEEAAVMVTDLLNEIRASETTKGVTQP